MAKRFDQLFELYTSLDTPGSFRTLNTFYEQARKKIKNLTLNEVRQFLESIPQKALFNKIRYNFKHVKRVNFGIHYQLSSDIMVLPQPWVVANGGRIRYLLTTIDEFSKRAWVNPLMQKSAGEVAAVLEPIIRTEAPLRFSTDRGSEFRGAQVQNLLRRYGMCLPE